MKKFIIIYLSITGGAGLILTLLSRLSKGFSEWYAATVYPLWVGTVGRFFGLFPITVTEILMVLLGLSVIAGLVWLVVRLIRCGKGNRKRVFAKSGIVLSMTVTTAFLIFMLNCGINYNRYDFLHNTGAKYERNNLDEWRVFLTILNDYYDNFPPDENGNIPVDGNGVFKPTSNIRKEAPLAMKKLAKDFPRMKVSFPKPSSTIYPNIMSDAFLLGYYSPFTVEATYNGIAPYTEQCVTVLHELSHVAGFMKEEEANFIAFLAAINSDNPELRYAGYVNVFHDIDLYLTLEEFEQFSDEDKELFLKLKEKSNAHWGRYRLDYETNDDWLDNLEEDREAEIDEGEVDENGNKLKDAELTDEEAKIYGLMIYSYDFIPMQVHRDLSAQSRFWWGRLFTETEVVNDDGETETILEENSFAGIISDVSSDINDTYLKTQGQSDGIASYGRMIDLVYAYYLLKIK